MSTSSWPRSCRASPRWRCRREATMRLQGRTAFVTGASREELEAVGEECRARGVRAVCVLGDVGDPDAVTRMVEGGLAVLGAIDVLVCNAAIRPHKSLTETTAEDWHRVFAVNLHSAFYLARAVVP